PDTLVCGAHELVRRVDGVKISIADPHPAPSNALAAGGGSRRQERASLPGRIALRELLDHLLPGGLRARAVAQCALALSDLEQRFGDLCRLRIGVHGLLILAQGLPVFALSVVRIPDVIL